MANDAIGLPFGPGPARRSSQWDTEHKDERTALVVLVAFLDLDGVDPSTTDDEVLGVVLAVAASEMTELDLAGSIEEHAGAS